MTKTIGTAIEELSAFATDAEILAMNCMSPMAHAGCFKFELCCKCESKKTCLAFMAKKFLDEYKKKGILV